MRAKNLGNPMLGAAAFRSLLILNANISEMTAIQRDITKRMYEIPTCIAVQKAYDCTQDEHAHYRVSHLLDWMGRLEF